MLVTKDLRIMFSKNVQMLNLYPFQLGHRKKNHNETEVCLVSSFALPSTGQRCKKRCGDEPLVSMLCNGSTTPTTGSTQSRWT